MNETHDIEQGSLVWQEFRLTKFGSSEIAAVLGLSLTTKRTELLHVKATGNPKVFSDFVRERVLDEGHRTEAAALPHVEKFIGAELYPVTMSQGRQSASCDGLTMDGSVAWEHKQWSTRLAEFLSRKEMPPEHMPQCQQVLKITGAEKLLFTVSDGTPENMLHLWVMPDSVDWFPRIDAAWEQFERDLAAYVPPAAEAPPPVGRAPDQLPALRIELRGEVSASNLAEFKATALTAIRSVNRELVTDEHFADAAKSVTWCEEVESRLKAAKQHALSQTASIDELFRTIDEISAEARDVRLSLDKLVTKRKQERKDEIVADGRKAYAEHLRTLMAETEQVWPPITGPDFVEAAKNKRSFASLKDAVDTVLANGKIAADAHARHIRAALALIAERGKEYPALFPDRTLLVAKSLDDLGLLIDARIAVHKAAEEKKSREAAEAAQRVTDERLRVERELADNRAAVSPPPLTQVAARPPAPITAPLFARAVPTTLQEQPTLTLGKIGQRLGFSLTEAFIFNSLGIAAAVSTGTAKLYRESDWHRVRDALRTYLGELD